MTAWPFWGYVGREGHGGASRKAPGTGVIVTRVGGDSRMPDGRKWHYNKAMINPNVYVPELWNEVRTRTFKVNDVEWIVISKGQVMVERIKGQIITTPKDGEDLDTILYDGPLG